MTPDRWRQIGELFDAALQVAPQDRPAWLEAACGADAELCEGVRRLLSGDESASRDDFLSPVNLPPEVGEALRSTGRRAEAEPAPAVGHSRRGFTPRPALAQPGGSTLHTEIAALVSKRLRALAIIYLSIFGILPFWRIAVGRDTDWAVTAVSAAVVLLLGGVVVVLSGRRPVSSTRRKLLELGMIVMIACLVTLIYYRLMRKYALQSDLTMMQIMLEHFVLYSAILILTFGLATPKHWQQAALIVGPLAALPFVTLLILCRLHPEAEAAVRQWSDPEAQLSFLAMILLILAVGSTYETQTIYRLRRQVVEVLRLNQYHLQRRIASGGMGEVYLAEHQLLKRACAVKLIRPHDAASPTVLARFEREVQITSSLTHPNIVEIYDYGRTEDGTYYYVMEYLSGLSLEELVKQSGPLPPGRTVYLLRQVCLALEAAHDASVIHRDIKPSNIIADRSHGREDVAKLLDFGLVLSLAASPTSHLTKEGQIFGTPLFMPPEQVLGGGRTLDARSDLYSLGAVAYYMLTGRPPFDAAEDIAVMIAHAVHPAAPPSHYRDGIPADLEQITLQCLSKNPADRFPTARALRQSLEACSCANEWGPEAASQWWRRLPDRNPLAAASAVSYV